MEAERGIRPLLWGEDHPTPEHPEKIEHVENVLIVVSFEKVPDLLLAAIRAKLQKVMNPTSSENFRGDALLRTPVANFQKTDLSELTTQLPRSARPAGQGIS